MQLVLFQMPDDAAQHHPKHPCLELLRWDYSICVPISCRYRVYHQTTMVGRVDACFMSLDAGPLGTWDADI